MSLLEPGDEADAYKAKILGYLKGADFLALQAAAPATLAILTSDLSVEQLAPRPAHGKWSIQEIAAHLADDELVGGYRIRLILSSPGTGIQAFDQDIWARTGRYATTDTAASVEMFRILRHSNLALPLSLFPEECDLAGINSERGA